MPEQQDYYSETLTEAVAVFHDAQSLQSAVDDLLSHGFDRAELSVLADAAAIEKKLGRGYTSTAELQDDPDVPRTDPVSPESVGEAQGALIGIGVYFPAIIGTILTISSGGTLPGAIAVAAIAGGAGGVFGAALAALVGQDHARRYLDEHLRHGGLLLWVRTRDAAHEKAAGDILRRNCGRDVHLHVLPAPKHDPRAIPTRRPLLSLGPSV